MWGKIKIIFLVGIVFLVLPFFVFADYGGQKTTFFVDSNYDLLNRQEVEATLIRISPQLYFYLEDNWWNALDRERTTEVKFALQSLEEEFENKIYPELSETFGSEWKPGIDKDPHITVLIHPIKKEAGGYTNTGDEYPKLQNPFSNEREIIYLNSKYITSPLAKSFLAHEFLHLITFNQKERIQGVTEEIWLNEARADFAPTFLGYDENYQDSNLQRRVKAFLQSPTDSLTEWLNESPDYGVINLFTQYLVDHYGIEILRDSLKSEKVGIPSLNYALEQNGFSENFSQIFTDWTIAVFLNDCSLFPKYCYLNENLKNLRVSPSLNFLPLFGKSTLAFTYGTKNWAGNWYKIIGGQGDLKIEFIGFPDRSFKIPYLTEDSSGSWTVNFFELDNSQQGKVLVSDFGTKIRSVVMAPSLQDKIIGFDGEEIEYAFFWSASTQEEIEGEQPTQTEDIQTLVQKIEFLKRQLETLQAELKKQLAGEEQEEKEEKEEEKEKEKEKETFSQTLEQNLRYGDRKEDVKVLQTWLAKDSEIYPEALITGYFGPLTQAAVIRFQEKYKKEVLAFWGLEKGTGFVGQTTRAKLNELYGGKLLSKE